MCIIDSTVATIRKEPDTMNFYTMITSIAVCGMGIWFVLRMVQMAYAHDEKIKRMKYGYPPANTEDAAKDEEPYIDTRDNRSN